MRFLIPNAVRNLFIFIANKILLLLGGTARPDSDSASGTKQSLLQNIFANSYKT